MPVMEDEHGTYILNSRDLRAVEHVHRLVAMGVDSLKIEGRTKSRYYVARTAQVYRRAIDDAVAGRDFDPALLVELDGLAHRGYTAGFLQRHPAQDLQNYGTGSSQPVRSLFVGEVVACGGGWAEVETRNRFAVGDRLEIIHPAGNRTVRLERMRAAASGEPCTWRRAVRCACAFRWKARRKARCSRASSIRPPRSPRRHGPDGARRQRQAVRGCPAAKPAGSWWRSPIHCSSPSTSAKAPWAMSQATP